VWTAAFALASAWRAELPTAALIGLGIGLAGTKALELIESGVLRAMGKQPVTRAEVEDIVGNLRNDTQAVVSEINVKSRRERKEKGDAE
jgi:hypothetical protein